MAFFECEFPRKIGFHRVGGQGFNTAVVPMQSGQEKRNRNWSLPRAEYTCEVLTAVNFSGSEQTFIDALRQFFMLIAGQGDGFRFFDEIDNQATNQPLIATADPAVFQLGITYSLGGRTLVRPITKPITSAVIDYLGNPCADTVSVSGGASTVDETTGLVTYASAPGGIPTADFQYHIPVRLTTDKFQPQIKSSAPGHRQIVWNSLGLIEVRPPNY